MLANDLARKPRHQKAASKQRWREEIAALERRLRLQPVAARVSGD
jgi:hypothetical protein